MTIPLSSKSSFLTIFFNVDRADQLDCRRWRDNIKKVVRYTFHGGSAKRNDNEVQMHWGQVCIMPKLHGVNNELLAQK